MDTHSSSSREHPQQPQHDHVESQVDPACAMAHGDLPLQTGDRTLVAVFASPVAGHLLHFGRHLGYDTVLVEPDQARVPDELRAGPHRVVASVNADAMGPSVDVVVTDHDRSELGPTLASVLDAQTRWVGVMGSPRHAAPHVAALAEAGVPAHDVARVHRPIGLNIGSKSPAEIALATLAGLVADRNDRPGGFDFSAPSPATTR